MTAVQVHQGLRQLPSLAPSLRFALEILQMPLAQLQRYVVEQVEENPLLELVEASSAPAESTSAPSGNEQSEEPDAGLPGSFHDASDREGVRDEELSYDGPARAVSLHEHLLFQLHCLPDDTPGLTPAEALIEWLDPDGYLRTPLEDIAQTEGLSVAVLKQGLAVLHRLDPPGVGARSLSECLLIQLAHRNQSASLAARIIRDHFETFTKRRLNELVGTLHASPSEVRAACEAIARLDPKPAGNFSADPALPLIPDLIVRKVGEQYEVELNEEALSRVRLNPRYRNLLRDPSAPADAKQFLRERLQQALWLLKALEQRSARLLGIGRCLVELERDYLENGVSHLRALTQDEVASAVGCHASTISRGIAHKTLQTPYGIVPLEQFFGGGIADGQHPSSRLSAHSIRAELTQLIASEDSAHPLSDQALMEDLRTRGYPVARRTVAKYREQLNILSAHLRRQLPAS
ncbi:MAG: RNA polymerase factor sigma-54 [Candidatus Omnitrophota bacterium]|nr:RNA polymerase factor sigma-54 [Candidatus Omnitrophota bacterium]